MSLNAHTRKTMRRITQYAKATGIEFSPHLPTWNYKKAGLPDLRGFTPHLRRVSVPLGKTRDLWVMHDLLHILFYDFATHHLGAEAWNNFERFFENHLASEAFAVLVLDYHLLSFEERGGLAVEVRAGNWKKFQKLNPDLPDFLTADFCRLLIDLYLKGELENFALPRKVQTTAEYTEWFGHEVRYSEKQRRYVNLWWNDLNLKASTTKNQAIRNSEVHFAVWELLETLLYGTDASWKEWIQTVKTSAGVFSTFPKYGKKKTQPDFRFTSIQSQNRKSLLALVKKAIRPSGSSLFLFWQILALVPKTAFSPEDFDQIESLALSSQTSGKNVRAWKNVQKLCLITLSKIRFKKDVKLRGVFFLP